MSQYTLIRGARQLLTLRGSQGPRRGVALQDLAIVPDGAILIKDGVIAAVGSSRRLENLKEARTAMEVDAHGSVVMPGFVDAGLRVALRGASSEQPKRLSQQYEQNLDLLRACLHHGTLHAEIRASADGLDFHSDLSVLRRLAKIGDHPVGMVRTWRLAHLPAAGEVKDFEDTLARLARKRFIHFVEVSAGEDTCIPEGFTSAMLSAGVGVKLTWLGGSAESLAAKLELLRPTSVACGTLRSKEEAEVLARFDTVLTYSSRYDPGGVASATVQHFLRENGALAIASGYDAQESPGFSMQMAVSLPAVRGDLTLEGAISAATVNAAWAVGRGAEAGTIEVGKRADLLVLTLGDYREIPRQFGINHVGMVFRDGEVVLNRSRWKIGAHEPTNGRVRAQHV